MQIKKSNRKRNESISFDDYKRNIELLHAKNGYLVVDFIEIQNVKRNKSKVIMLCPIHGEWNTGTINNIMSGKGCPHCAKNVKSTTEMFIKNAKIVHGNQFDYSETIYTKSKEKVKITHNLCGNSFLQVASAHLSGNNCPHCNKSKRSSTEEFISTANKIHNNEYNYEKTIYKNKDTKVKITHNLCGNTFFQTPHNHIRGGCPYCASYGFRLNKDGYLYICKMFNEKTGHSFVGYGKTNYPENRFVQHTREAKKHNYIIVSWNTIKKDSAAIASSLEQYIKTKFVSTDIKIKGFKTENSDINNYLEILSILAS